MDNPLQIISIPAIAAIVLTAMSAYKSLFKTHALALKIMPLVAMALGAAAAIAAFYAIPAVMPASNVVSAIMLGLAAGGASAGIHVLAVKKPDGKVEIEIETPDGKIIDTGIELPEKVADELDKITEPAEEVKATPEAPPAENDAQNETATE